MHRRGARHLQSDVAHLDPLTQMLYIDTRANLPDDLLMVGDKTSMANSLEVRVPFLDHRLVEFIESLPPGLKLRGLDRKVPAQEGADEVAAARSRLPQEEGLRAPGREVAAAPRCDRSSTNVCFAADSTIGRYFDQALGARASSQAPEGQRATTCGRSTCCCRSSSGTGRSSLNRAGAAMEVSIVIVNWNSKDYLARAVAAVGATLGAVEHEIVVIDSGSFDGSGEMLGREHPDVRFIQSADNLGFARANNEAARRCRRRVPPLPQS